MLVLLRVTLLVKSGSVALDFDIKDRAITYATRNPESCKAL